MRGRLVPLAVVVGLLMVPLAGQAEDAKAATSAELKQMLDKAKSDARARGAGDDGLSGQTVKEVTAQGAADAASAGKAAAVQQAQPSQGGAASGKAARLYQGRGVAQLRWFAGSTPQATGQFVQTQLAGGKSGGGKSSGTFAFRRPGHFRWEIDKPDPQLIVTDGKKLYFYDEGLRQVTVREASEAIQATPAAVLFGVGDLDEAFKLSEVGQYNGVAWVEAVPRSADSGFDRIRIGMRDGLPVVMEVVDAFGQINRFEFSNLSTNERIPAERFHFKVPAGVDVLE